MDTLIAAAHIIGSLVALLILVFAWLIVVAWEGRRNARIQTEDVALELGISPNDEMTEDTERRIRLWLSSRYSGELLRNRLSDLCGLVRTIWDAIGTLSVAAVECVVIWRTFSLGTSNAVYAWFAVPAWLFFTLSGSVFALVCKLLTGRYPGQAKAARKTLAKGLWDDAATGP